MFKKQLFTLLVLVFASWQSHAQQIVTSKKEAIKKGIYSYNNPSEKGPSVPSVPVEDNTVIAESEPVNTVPVSNVLDTPKEKSRRRKNNRNKKAAPDKNEDTEPSIEPWLAKISDEANYEPFPYENYLALQIVNNALQFEGVRYRTGGTDTKGMDCSGMVYATFQIFDISLPRSSSDQATVGRKIDLSDARKGDLLFFKNNSRRKQINHVGLVTEITDEGEIKFIHAALHGGVIISSMSESYYEDTFAQINRVIED